MKINVRTFLLPLLATWVILTATLSIAADQSPQPPLARVVVDKVTVKSVAENDSFIGLLSYDREAMVSSEVAGLVVEMKVDEGDRVKKGDPLVILDTELLGQEIATVKTEMEQLELRIRYTEKNYKRLEALFLKDGVSESDLDDARYAFDDASMGLQVAKRRLETLEIRQRKSIIGAPFSGVVLDKSVEVGDWVSQGKQLARIGDEGELFVRVPLAERLLRFVKKGAKVPVSVIAFGREVHGTVADIDPTADAKTKNVFVKVRIPRLAGAAENMSATVHVPTSPKRDLAMIPRDALIKFQGGDFVYTIKEGKAAILPVNIVSFMGDRVGADNPYFVEGMEVVVEGNERLRPDQPVISVPAGGE